MEIGRMRCVWEHPDGCRCEDKVVLDYVVCQYHYLHRDKASNEGVKRYWLGSKAKRRTASHVDNHGRQPVMVGAGWSAW